MKKSGLAFITLKIDRAQIHRALRLLPKMLMRFKYNDYTTDEDDQCIQDMIYLCDEIKWSDENDGDPY